MWRRRRPGEVARSGSPFPSPLLPSASPVLFAQTEGGGELNDQIGTLHAQVCGLCTGVEVGVDSCGEGVVKERHDDVVQPASGVLHVGTAVHLKRARNGNNSE